MGAKKSIFEVKKVKKKVKNDKNVKILPVRDIRIHIFYIIVFYIVKVLVLAQDQDSLLRHPLDRAVPASLLFTSIRLFDSDAEYLPKP